MVRWVDDVARWDGRLPAALVAVGVASEHRDAPLRDLVARVLDHQPNAVVIERVKGRPPVLARPACSGLHVSSSSRGPVAVWAIAKSPVGIDVELAEPQGEIPWNVLHPEEAAELRSHEGDAQSRAFARLWSLKEAYLKALGIGLIREPTSFAVSFVDEDRAAVRDPLAPRPVAEAETRWLSAGPNLAAISIVVLGPQPAGPGG
jgi:phosphopantetheinyl transferase